jgi:hypothetical protein
VRLRPGSANVEHFVEEAGFSGTLNRLHHFHGYDGGLQFWLWGFLVDVVSVSMIVFAVSGVYMWYVLKKDHTLGWIVLGASSLYVTGSLVFLLVRS